MIVDNVACAEATVLHVEDDDDDALYIMRMIKRLPQRVHVQRAQHGAQALRILLDSACLPDFILLDLNMPVMDGFRFLSEVRSRPRFDAINIVVLTTLTDPSVLADLRSRGAAATITKDAAYEDEAKFQQLLIDYWFHGLTIYSNAPVGHAEQKQSA